MSRKTTFGIFEVKNCTKNQNTKISLKLDAALTSDIFCSFFFLKSIRAHPKIVG